MSLHHYTTGFPPWFKPPTGQLKVQYHEHALAASVMDRYGRLPCPDVLDLKAFQVVEIETNDRWPRGPTQRVTKYVLRGACDAQRDVVYVVKYIDNRPTVITMWCNLKSDQHKTLRKDKYRGNALPRFPSLAKLAPKS